jgi:tRNA (guanine10-N2)-dimethyltransferase
VAKLFFLISGEFETLSFSELKAILEAEGYSYTLIEKLDQVVRLEADPESVKQVHRRAGYTRVCAQELFTCDASDEAITEAANNADFKTILAEGETFEVRIRRIKEYSTKDATMHHERLLGKLILQNAPHAKVNLKKPDKTFFGILTKGKLVFGLKLAEIIPKPFVERRARKKPFFHPSAMNAKLARCMVNLAHAREGTYVLDPFCGTGSTAIEATLIGCKALGMDVQRRMANGAKRNLQHFGLTAEGIIVADARKLPLARVDCVVTDPPYGRSSTTMKSNTKAIVEGGLASAHSLLDKGQRICIALPIKVNREGQTEQLSEQISSLVQNLGYSLLESHKVYVHRSLTREVIVYQKN